MHKNKIVIDKPEPLPPQCVDMPDFANCNLIIQTPHYNPDSYCNDNEYYSKFCCKSCIEAGLPLFSQERNNEDILAVLAIENENSEWNHGVGEFETEY